MRIALIHEVYCDETSRARLRERLHEARAAGAELALLPELPLNPWSPAERIARPEDAEEREGERWHAQADAARDAGIALVGGVIELDREGRRRNTALAFDAAGREIGRYAKVHLPEEPGFWETDHYQPGDEPPRAIGGLSLPFGIQICSDVNRPVGCQLLAAEGVACILVPRATELATWERWKLALRADALTSSCYVVSANRPGPEAGVGLGGPSFAAAPDGSTLLESEALLETVDLDEASVEAARRAYPGYLPQPADLYERGWAAFRGAKKASAVNFGSAAGR